MATTVFNTAGSMLVNPDWSEADVAFFDAAGQARGFALTYEEKEAQYQYRIAAGGGNADSVEWDDIQNRPDLSKVKQYTFAVGTAPDSDNTIDESFEAGTTFQSDLLIGAHLQIRLGATPIAPESAGYSYVPGTGTITTNSSLNNVNMYVLAVYDIAGTSTIDYLTTETGDFLTTEDGTFLIL